MTLHHHIPQRRGPAQHREQELVLRPCLKRMKQRRIKVEQELVLRPCLKRTKQRRIKVEQRTEAALQPCHYLVTQKPSADVFWSQL